MAKGRTAAMLAALLALGAAGCGKNERWTDEALLHDGRTIEVERSVAFHFGGGELSNALTQWPDQYSLTARHPHTQKAVRWSGDRGFSPILLDFHDKVPYLVIVASHMFADLKQYGCPEIPYVFLRQNESDGRWVQIPPRDFPPQLLRANLSFRYDGFYMKDGARQSTRDIEERNRLSEPSSSNFITRAIPTDFASWKSAHKNEYRVGHYRDGCRHTVPSNEDAAHPQSAGQPSQTVALEILDSKVYDPEWVIPGNSTGNPEWTALSWDAARYAQCEKLIKRVDDRSSTPELRGWLLFVNDPTGRKKARERGQMFCNSEALWFTDYTVEPGRAVLTKFTIAGDFVYRLSFAKPDEPGHFLGGIMYSTFRAENGQLAFEWWNSNQSGYDWRVRRSMKVRLQEPK